MSLFRVDDRLHNHPKAIEAGLEAMGLWVLMGSHCGFYVGQRGQVSRPIALRIAGSKAVLNRCAKRLVDAGLWHVDGDGWVFHDWDRYLQEAKTGRRGGRAKALAATERKLETSPELATKGGR
jgi:hypothetical protein